MRSLGADHVYLDAREIPEFTRRFPTITMSCRAAGIDPRRELIPVAPAAHYQCGGVVTDLHGRTDVPGLYAAGEVARTGLHGANRLASNSLLEGLVMGERAGLAALERLGEPATVTGGQGRGRPVLPRPVLQQTMTEHASVVRDGAGLARAARVLDTARGDEPATVPAPRAATPADAVARVEDAALTVTARALVLAARVRTESRGCHTRSDHPQAAPGSAQPIVVRLDEAGTPRVVAEPTPLAAPS
jgi:L-aspartate oxidase